MSSNEDLERGYHHPRSAALLLRWLSIATVIIAVIVFFTLGSRREFPDLRVFYDFLPRANSDWPMAVLALICGLLLATFLHIGAIFLEWCAAMYRRTGTGAGSNR